jgi:hypothetical protein
MCATHRRGHTRWHRFTVVFVPALLALTLFAAATATGTVPVELTAARGHPLKLRIDSFSAASTIPSIGPYETRDGDRRTELLFHFRDLTLRGLCLSNRVATPVGTYTLRITAPTLTADRLTVSLDSINALDLLGQQLNVGDLPNLIPLNNTPLGTSDDPGFLDLKLGNALAAISLTIRYFSASHFNVTNVHLASARSRVECF